MDIKCLHPVILINPEARKKALDFDRIYITFHNKIIYRLT